MAVIMRRLLSDSPEKYCFSKFCLADGELSTVVDLDMPSPEVGHKIVGYCNGLFCVEYADGKIIVWNPSNKSFQEIPSPTANSISISISPSPSHTLILVCGFGHDINTDDYKVIVHVITCFDNGGISNSSIGGFVREALVYSIVDGIWKEIPYPCDLHSVGVMDASGTSVNGCCYWIAEAVGENTYPEVCILSLDLATLEFSLVDPPHHLRNILRSEIELITLVELEGSLSVISLETFSPYMKSWVWMGRLGWRPKHELQLWGEAESGIALGYVNDQFMLYQASTHSHLLIYDTARENFWRSSYLIQDRWRSMRLFPYVESTLHLNNSFS